MSVPPKEPKKMFTVRTFAADLEANRGKLESPKKGKKEISVLPKKESKKEEASIAPVANVKTVPIKVGSGYRSDAQVVTKTLPQHSTEIPPFHSFQKPGPRKAPVVKVGSDTTTFNKTDLKAAASKHTASTLTTPSHDVLVGDAAKDADTATIITDTKHKRFSLSRSLRDSLSSWVEDKKDIITGKKKPKYSVPQADRRKGVIQKATSMTGRASTADHAQVLERLRSNKKNNPIPTSASTVSKTAVKPSWENDRATEYKTVTAEVVTVSEIPVTTHKTVHNPSVVTPPPELITTPHTHTHTTTESTAVAAPHSPEPTIVTPKVEPVPLTVAPPAEKPPKKIAPITPTIPTYQIPRVAPPTPIPPVIPTQTIETTPELPPTPPTKVVTPVIPKKSLPLANLETWFADTNRIVLAGGGLIVSLVLVWGIINIGSPLEFFTSTEKTATVPPLFSMSTQENIFLSSLSRTQILMTLSTPSSEEVSLIEYQLVSASSSETLTGSELFTNLEIKVPIAFTAGIVRATPGRYRNEPWLALQVVDKSTGLGGMLTWEKNLSRDLSPWFGEALDNTSFRDGSIQGLDIRILTDTTGKERIVYGFIQPQILLIATSENTFLNLMQNVPSE